MSACLCIESFFLFSRDRLHHFVLSALDVGEFKGFDCSIYWNLRKLSFYLFSMFRDTTLNLRGFGMLMWEQLYFIGYILISFNIDYRYFQSWQTAQSLFPQILESMEMYSDGKIQKSELKLRSSNLSGEILTNQSHKVCLQ